jgi:hypothetical protein
MVDYKIWDLRNMFTAREAAHLWFEIDPNENEIPEHVKPKIKTMEGLFDEFISEYSYESDGDKLGRMVLKDKAEKMNKKPLFLFPEERESRNERHDINKQAKGTGFRHSSDFRSVTKDGKPFSFTSKQAQVIQMLFQGQQKGTPELGIDYIIDEVSPGTSKTRLRDIFKHDPETYKALIEKGRKGTVRLKR